jgi:hypothetical protein
MAGCLLGGVFERVVPVEDGQNIGVRDTVESSIPQHGFDLVTLRGSAALERVNHGHRRFALSKVACDWLSEHTFGRRQVEHIVHDLESHAEVAPVLPKAFFLLQGRSSQGATDAHANGEKASSLAVDKVEILLLGNQLAELFHLQQFALNHLLGELDEHIKDVEVALLNGISESLHVEPVAGKHTLRISPLGIRRRAPSPEFCIVNDVVVHQRRCMNNFDHRCKPYRSRALVPKQFGGEQKQGWTNALAAARPQVFPDLGDGGNVRNRVLPELLLDRDDVIAQEIENLFPVNGRSAQKNP